MPHKQTIAIDARPLSMAHTGVALYIKTVTQILIDNGYDVSLVSDKKLIHTDLPFKDVKEYIIGDGHSGVYWEQFLLRRFLKKLKPDIYFATWNSGFPYGYLGKTKFLVAIHDLIPMELKKVYNFGPKQRLMYWLNMKLTARFADVIVTLSQTSIKLISKFLNKDAKLVTFGLPQVPHFMPEKQPRKYFVYLGGVDPRKRVLELIRAMHLLHQREDAKDVSLYLVGANFGIYTGLIQDLGLEGVVVLTGYVTDKEKYRILSGSTALVYPSMAEGYGLTPAEAIACDVPVIVGDNSALREVAGKAGMFIDPLDPSDICSAMLKLLDPKARAKQLREVQARKSELNDVDTSQALLSVIDIMVGEK